MARTAKPKKEVSMEEALWKSADKLRGSVEPAEYKHVVLSLFFLKFAGDKFDAQREMIAKQYGEKFVDTVAFYTKDNVFYLPPESRWSYIMENAKQDDIALKIDTALYTIEKNNPALKGALPDNYYSRLQLDTAKLASLLDEINRINTDDKENDIIGRIYEYFLSKFALAEGKGKGEFYTPKCIVNLIAEMLEPYDGILYDPCCGSGGMFVQSMKFVEAHHGNKKQVSIYGQEYTNTTYKLCKMNLAIRGISANLGETAANTFTNDQHKDLKADYIMANPPFNQKAWRAENELIDDPRWDGYEVPPTSNANYGWILNIVSKLSQNGVAGFLLANGALSDDGTELKIRKQLIENNLVEAIIILPRNLFYTTDISVTLWILNKNKKARVIEQNGQLKRYRNREREILFMDLRQMGSPYEKKYIELTEEDRAKITSVYHNWQQEGYEETYENIPEFCYSASFEEVAEKGFTLVPSRYIEFVNRDENIDFDTKMKTLQAELKELLVQEEKSKADLLAVFKELGYTIPLNEDIYDYLASLFHNHALYVVFMLSNNYYGSPACLNEMGAAWVLKNEYTSILLPKFEYKEIKGAVNPNKIGMKLDDEEELLKKRLGELKNIISERFNISVPDMRWEKKRNDFIEKIKGPSQEKGGIIWQTF